MTAVWREWRGLIVFLAILMAVRMIIVDWNHVPSRSMVPMGTMEREGTWFQSTMIILTAMSIARKTIRPRHSRQTAVISEGFSR